ncbi:MAG: Uma2 family endonuclease [Parasporobacterium sp.]|nr:Uma2 family endonuclease [Parasporobacterium sp.]
MYPNKKQGSYTLEDYLALPDDLRVELIDGVFYDLAAPRVNHQLIATQIVHQLMRHIEEQKGPCKPVFSPVDVQLDQDDKTVVQPDILILCRPETLIKNGRVFGAPDFIIEILSHSTRKKDMTLKLAKYSEAGVREYWMIDPDKLIVVVYDLEHEELPKLYNFTSKIPVLIWKEEFSVDFNAVYEYIKDYR